MLQASTDQLKYTTRWQGTLFLIIGTYSLVYFVRNTYNGWIAFVEALLSLLLMAIGTTGIYSTYGQPELVNLYNQLLRIYGAILAGFYSLTCFIALLYIFIFPICDETVDPECKVRKQTALAIIAILVVFAFLEFLLGLLYIYTYKTAIELKKALD